MWKGNQGKVKPEVGTGHMDAPPVSSCFCAVSLRAPDPSVTAASSSAPNEPSLGLPLFAVKLVSQALLCGVSFIGNRFKANELVSTWAACGQIVYLAAAYRGQHGLRYTGRLRSQEGTRVSIILSFLGNAI